MISDGNSAVIEGYRYIIHILLEEFMVMEETIESFGMDTLRGRPLDIQGGARKIR